MSRAGELCVLCCVSAAAPLAALPPHDPMCIVQAGSLPHAMCTCTVIPSACLLDTQRVLSGHLCSS